MPQWTHGTLVLSLSSSSAPQPTTHAHPVSRARFPSFPTLKRALALQPEDALDLRWTACGIRHRTTCAGSVRALRNAMDERWEREGKERLIVEVGVRRGEAVVLSEKAEEDEAEQASMWGGLAAPFSGPAPALVDFKVVLRRDPQHPPSFPAPDPAPAAHLLSFIATHPASFADFLLEARDAVGLSPYPSAGEGAAADAVEVVLLPSSGEGEGGVPVRIRTEREWAAVAWTRAKKVGEEARARGDWGAVTVELRVGGGGGEVHWEEREGEAEEDGEEERPPMYTL
ncbi:hypothetical protein JCM10207_000019 [Rhodosporidiobolus poonsookiae]